MLFVQFIFYMYSSKLFLVTLIVTSNFLNILYSLINLNCDDDDILSNTCTSLYSLHKISIEINCTSTVQYYNVVQCRVIFLILHTLLDYTLYCLLLYYIVYVTLRDAVLYTVLFCSVRSLRRRGANVFGINEMETRTTVTYMYVLSLVPLILMLFSTLW